MYDSSAPFAGLDLQLLRRCRYFRLPHILRSILLFRGILIVAWADNFTRLDTLIRWTVFYWGDLPIEEINADVAHDVAPSHLLPVAEPLSSDLSRELMFSQIYMLELLYFPMLSMLMPVCLCLFFFYDRLCCAFVSVQFHFTRVPLFLFFHTSLLFLPSLTCYLTLCPDWGQAIGFNFAQHIFFLALSRRLYCPWWAYKLSETRRAI